MRQFFADTVQICCGICKLPRIAVDKADTSHNLRVSRYLRHPPAHTVPALQHPPDARRWQERRSRRSAWQAQFQLLFSKSVPPLHHLHFLFLLISLCRIILHQFLQRQCAVVGNVAAIHKYTVILKYLLDTVVAIVIEFFKVLVIFVMTGPLDHVPPKLLRRVDIWCEIKLIEVFCQLADICCTRRFRHLADRAELHEILFLEI